MCDNVNWVVDVSKRQTQSWKPLYNYLTRKCQCPTCQEKYLKIKASLKIRNYFRRKLKIGNNNCQVLKSISDHDIPVLQQKWITPLHDHINDLSMSFCLLQKTNLK